MAELQAPEHLCSAQPMELRRRAASLHGDPYTLEQVAQLLRREERVVFAVGLEARHAGPEVMQLAEAVGAPVVTRLDAKGAVDESHPLALGVIGVHGKPGLAATAAVIEAATLVVAFGVSERRCSCVTRTLQVRRMVEVAPDAFDQHASAPSTRCSPTPPPRASSSTCVCASQPALCRNRAAAAACRGGRGERRQLGEEAGGARGVASDQARRVVGGVVSTKAGGWFSTAGLPRQRQWRRAGRHAVATRRRRRR